MRKNLILLFLLVQLSGCGYIQGAITVLPGVRSGPDFARSQVLTGSPAAADGHSEILVALQMTNSDGTSVPFYTPTYEVLSGLGVVYSACTNSNVNGVSTCLVRATSPGIKILSFTNVKIDLQADVVFVKPASKPVLEVVAAGANVSKSGFQMSGTVGGAQARILNSTASGWKLYGGLEGLKASQ
ncbi:MAG: hypothetical protein EOP06_00250 [Proteobacteria bacterium]|nr:MAG: hypothetical protein EOP06_00250 [Pseudomonadota bacterium]